jgi:hypothetical protein
MHGRNAVAYAVTQLEATPRILQALIEGLGDGETTAKPGPSSFSVAETIAHLLHVETHCYQPRIAMILEQEIPLIATYDAKRYEAEGAYVGTSAREALRAFSGVRSTNLSVLKSLSIDRFDRCGRHETVGLFTLRELIHECAAHDLGHIRQIAIILRDTLYAPAMGAFKE